MKQQQRAPQAAEAETSALEAAEAAAQATKGAARGNRIAAISIAGSG